MKRTLTPILMVTAALSLTSCDKIQNIIASLSGNQSAKVAAPSATRSKPSPRAIVSSPENKTAEAVKNADGFPIYFECDVKEDYSASDKDGTKDIWVDRPRSFSVIVSKTDKGLSATINDGFRAVYVDGFAHDYGLNFDGSRVGTRHDTVKISDIELRLETHLVTYSHEGKNRSELDSVYSVDRLSGKVNKSLKNNFESADSTTDHSDLTLAEGSCKVVDKKF